MDIIVHNIIYISDLLPWHTIPHTDTFILQIDVVDVLLNRALCCPLLIKVELTPQRKLKAEYGSQCPVPTNEQVAI